MRQHALKILISNRNNTITQTLYQKVFMFKAAAFLMAWYKKRDLNELIEGGAIRVVTQYELIEKPLIKKKIIYNHEGKPYLIRRSLLNTKWFSVKIHHILLSDPACLHDHPWTFVSLLLKGSYIEHTDAGSKRFGPLSLLYRPAPYAHRLEIAEPVWSLVITFKKVRQWGFITPAGWVEWFKYQRAESCD